MKAPEPLVALESSGPQDVALENVSFAYDGGAPIFRGLTLTAYPGDIIGVMGPVACGKSTLGRVFLCKQCYGASIRIGGRELSGLTPREIAGLSGPRPRAVERHGGRQRPVRSGRRRHDLSDDDCAGW